MVAGAFKHCRTGFGGHLDQNAPHGGQVSFGGAKGQHCRKKENGIMGGGSKVAVLFQKGIQVCPGVAICSDKRGHSHRGLRVLDTAPRN